VNGDAVREHVLRPGDVLALSDVMIVYGEGRDEPLGGLSLVGDDDLDTTMQKPYE